MRQKIILLRRIINNNKLGLTDRVSRINFIDEGVSLGLTWKQRRGLLITDQSYNKAFNEFGS